MNKKKVFLALTVLFSDTTMAYQETNLAKSPSHHLLTPWNSSPWSTRFFGQGLVGDAQQLAGVFDGMFPVAGNLNSLWYLDGGVLSGQNNNLGGSIGSGLRALKNWRGFEAIVGGFLFADYQQNGHQSNQWIANPGLELLTRHHELRVQGYLPIDSRVKTYEQTMASLIPQNILASSGQSTTNVYRPVAHSVIDTPVALNNEYGRGIEAEAGQYIPLHKGSWLRAGVYHFDYPNANNITGVEANYELFLNKNASLILQDNYDNQNKNRFSLGLRVRFGGPDSHNVAQLSNRMEEPIIRHLARQSYGMVTPVRDSFTVTGPEQIVRDNLWFFSPNGTIPNQITFMSCTAEHPCLNLNQDISTGIDAISPNATLWFATGSYQLPVQPSFPTSHYVIMANGQSVVGRTSDFRNTANGSDRPLVTGALYWNGNGNVSNMQVTNNNQILPFQLTGSANAVTALGGTTLNIRNSLVTATNSGANAYAVNARENVFVDSSTINIQSTGSNITYAVLSSEDATVINSTINAEGLGTLVAAIQADGTATTSNSTVFAQGANDVYGVSTGINLVLNQNSQVTVEGNNAVGVNALNIAVADSTISVQAGNSGYGVQTYADGVTPNIVNVVNSTINVNNTGSDLTEGVYSDNTATVNNTTIAITGETVFGVQADVIGVSGATINMTSTNTVLAVGAAGVYGITSATITDSTISMKSVQGAPGTNIYGARANSLLLDSSTVNVISQTGSIANGVFGVNGLTIRNFSSISAIGYGTGNVQAARSFSGSITVADSTITALTNGTGLVKGILSITGAPVNISNASIGAYQDNPGNSSTIRGIDAAGSTVTFSGSQSQVVANRINGSGTSTAIISTLVNNNSTPPTVCTVNGVSTTC